MFDDPLEVPSEVEIAFMDRLAAGRREMPAFNKASFCTAVITPPDDTERRYLTQREFLPALKNIAIPLEDGAKFIRFHFPLEHRDGT
jgi:hypothetical protein